MDHRIQKALDGELPREQLNAAEAAELASAEADIAVVMRAVPIQPMPDLAPSVMRRIARAESPRADQATQEPAATKGSSAVHALLGWIWKPRPISFGWRPAYGLIAAAVLAVALVIGRETTPSPAASRQVLTQFLLNAPNAEQVMLAGDFTDWQPAHALSRTAAGVWTVVVPLNPGVHSYAFVVDGERWVADPNAPAVDDGFGGLNSRLAVLAPDEVES
ncbi:MAG TPA: glycogen-binding domain-containing protein [Longimicrobiales bacterium]|nr:glycogen-binding domain-containing protein [Longimicrobiales bacterium]